MRLFSAFLKNRRIAPRKGKHDTLFVWQFLIFGGVGNERKMKKFFKNPSYPGLCGFVRNEGKFQQINVHFTFCGFVGIRGRNVSAALAESPPRPPGVSENAMRYFRRNATNPPLQLPLLILDDFGMERGTEYGLEQVYNVIDSRYRSGKPLIVTTNLILEELQNPEDAAHARIYDRLTEMCCPVCITGENFRKTKAREKMERLRLLMNGAKNKDYFSVFAHSYGQGVRVAR